MLRFAAGNKGTDAIPHVHWCCARSQQKKHRCQKLHGRRRVAVHRSTCHRMSINHRYTRASPTHTQTHDQEEMPRKCPKRRVKRSSSCVKVNLCGESGTLCTLTCETTHPPNTYPMKYVFINHCLVCCATVQSVALVCANPIHKQHIRPEPSNTICMCDLARI